MEPAKVLIIRFSSIGDIVLTTPLLRQLKQKLVEGSEIHYLTKPNYASILEHNPHVDKLHTLQENLNDTISALSAEHYDFIFDLHRNLRSAMVKKKLGSMSFTLDKKNTAKWKLVNFPWYTKPVEHIVKRYLDVAKPFGVEEDGKGLEFYPAPTSSVPHTLPASPFIAWVLGGAHRGKRLSERKNRELLAQVDYPVVLLGGKDEEALGEKLASTDCINLAGKLTLDESALSLKASALVVSGDTGLMHIASAFAKPIVSLWGCTSPAFGMDPYGPNKFNTIVEPNALKKRPCSKLGDRCKYGWKNQCTEHLKEDEVITAIHRALL